MRGPLRAPRLRAWLSAWYVRQRQLYATQKRRGSHHLDVTRTASRVSRSCRAAAVQRSGRWSGTCDARRWMSRGEVVASVALPRVTVCIPTYDRDPLARHGDRERARADVRRLPARDPRRRHAWARPCARSSRASTTRAIASSSTNQRRHRRQFHPLVARAAPIRDPLGDDDEVRPTCSRAPSRRSTDTRAPGSRTPDSTSIVRPARLLLRGRDWTVGGGRPPLESGREFIRRAMLWGCRVCSSTALIRRSAVPPGGFLQEDFPPFDFACWLRMATGLGFRVRPAHAVPLPRAPAQPLGRRVRVHEGRLCEGHRGARRRPRGQAASHRRHGRFRELGRLARRGRAHSVLVGIRRDTLPARRLGPTMRGLAHGVRVEPALALHPEAWMLLAGSIAGPRAVDAVRG